MYKHGRRDKNHNEIKQFFKLAGFSVSDTADIGGGFPDLVIGKDGLSHCIEIKSGNAKLTPDEREWHSFWYGSAVIIRTIESAQLFIEYHNLTVEFLADYMPSNWHSNRTGKDYFWE